MGSDLRPRDVSRAESGPGFVVQLGRGRRTLIAGVKTTHRALVAEVTMLQDAQLGPSESSPGGSCALALVSQTVFLFCTRTKSAQSKFASTAELASSARNTLHLSFAIGSSAERACRQHSHCSVRGAPFESATITGTFCRPSLSCTFASAISQRRYVCTYAVGPRTAPRPLAGAHILSWCCRQRAPTGPKWVGLTTEPSPTSIGGFVRRNVRSVSSN